MKNTAVPYWLSLMVVLTASYMGWKWYQVGQFEANRSAGGIEMTGPPLEDFELAERGGGTFRSADMEGKIWVTTFFFSTCPGPCARLNARIKYMHELEALHDVTWVSITVDPKTDTLDVLKKYADSFSADPERWLFCRGDLKYIKRVGKDIMKLPVTWQGHNETAVVIDQAGTVRGMYDVTSISQSKKLELLLHKCLAEEVSDELQPEPESEDAESEGAGPVATAEPVAT